MNYYDAYDREKKRIKNMSTERLIKERKHFNATFKGIALRELKTRKDYKPKKKVSRSRGFNPMDAFRF